MTHPSHRTNATSWSSPRLFFAVIIVLLSLHTGNAINGGRLYALGFFNVSSAGQGLYSQPVFEEIAISCYQCNTVVKIRIPQLSITKVITLSTPSSTTYKYNITQDIATATPFPAGLTWSSIGVIITSNSSPIAVQVSKAVPGSSSGYLALPLYFYTNVSSQNNFNYFIASYSNVTNNAISIVAAYNDTCVEIYTRGQPSATSDPQIQQAFMLQSGDVFNMYSPSVDFTNYIVLSRKPLAVFGGLDYAQIPVGAASYDAIMEQMPGKLGGLFTLASIPGRPYSVGFRYRVVNAYDSPSPSGVRITEVAFDDTLTVPTIVSQQHVDLQEGHFYENSTTTKNFTIIVVVSDYSTSRNWTRYPIEVAQYNVGDSLQNPSGAIRSDPSMVVWPCADDGDPAYANGFQCYTQNITFSTLSVNYGKGAEPAVNYMTVLVYDGDGTGTLTNRLMFDGKLIKDLPNFTKWINVGTASGITSLNSGAYFSNHYITTVGPINDGFHTLVADNQGKFDFYNAVIYGHGNNPSYPTSNAFSAGWDNYLTASPPTFDSLIGNLADFSEPQTQVTTAAPDMATTAAPESPSLLEQLPTYGIVWVANFSTLPTDPDSKTTSHDCSNTYAKQFVFVISNYLAQAISTNVNTLIGCPSGVTVSVNVANYDDAYYSQYSTTGGSWNMTVTGSGQATLADIYVCAQNVISYTKSLINWRPSYNVKAQNMLQLTDPYFAKNFSVLAICPALYVKNLDNNGYLPVKAQSWLCTTRNSAVVSTSSSPPSAMLVHRVASIRAIVISLLALVVFNRLR